MIRYKFDILEALKEKGYNTNRIRKEKLFPEAVVTKFRNGNASIEVRTIEKLCSLLDLTPGDILEYVDTDLQE